jgi:hypothetical protein
MDFSASTDMQEGSACYPHSDPRTRSRVYRGLLGGDAAALEALLSRHEALLCIDTTPEEW